jgi:hypothetical protein
MPLDTMVGTSNHSQSLLSRKREPSEMNILDALIGAEDEFLEAP